MSVKKHEKAGETMDNSKLYNTYSEHLIKKYGVKVYKLPINLPITCPNRINSHGCDFCSEKGTGFEAKDSIKSVTCQLSENMEHIKKKYKAKKFIAYFQNYTNTFMPLEMFKNYIKEAAEFQDIVEIAISTRPDCIKQEYLDALSDISKKYDINISVELGLQTVNYHTLDKINRGHGLAEFIDAVLMIKPYGFEICTHVILNLPWDDKRDALETARILSALSVDCVKIHSLYIATGTKLARDYEAGEVSICSKEEYLERLVLFVENLKPDIVIERLFSRIPKDDAIFSNWGISWWKLRDEFEERLIKDSGFQGSAYNYLGGFAMDRGGTNFGIW